MSKNWLLVFGCHLVVTARGILGENPVVGTNSGKVKGKLVQHGDLQVQAYLGVPFATPPLGDLRFKRPLPRKPWAGTIDATKYPPACHQYGTGPAPWYDEFLGHSEDCLYLNIWVPSAYQDTPRAVFYWIFSGGFSFGSNRLPVYHGQALAAFGDIIVVSVNYRLGALGFLSSGTEDAPGNVGLYDALLGLKWVNENIECFGGDPSHITIGGQSAGSVMSELFSTSSLTRGLYRNAILESGSIVGPILFDGKEANFKLGQEVADHFGCSDGNFMTNPKGVVDCLRGVDAMELTRTVGKLKPRSVSTFLPVYDDLIVGNNPVKSVITGNFYATDILIGVVPDEIAFQVTESHSDIFGYFGFKSDRVNESEAEKLLQQEAFAILSDKEKLTKYYIGKSDGTEQSLAKQVVAAFSDVLIICPSNYYAEATALKNKNVYAYVFKKRPTSYKFWAPWMGIVHFDEVQFVFGQPTLNKARYTPEDYSLSMEMMRLWSNFIKNGKPDADWPPFTVQNHITRVLADAQSSTYQEGVHLDNCNVLRKYMIKI